MIRRWIAVTVVLAGLAAWYLQLAPGRVMQGIGNLVPLLRDALPPQWSLMRVAGVALVETLSIALLGTVFGFLLALPLGVAGARNLAPRRVFLVARTVSAAIRSFPSLLWAVVFVILVGVHPTAGVLAMTLYSTGHFAKLQAEGFEGLPAEPLEALRATGVGRLAIVRHAVLPDAANLLVSQALYMFDYNVRASAIVGFVGAGGIGFYIARYLAALQYDGVLALVLVVFVTVLALDALSFRLRARFRSANLDP
ncbi:MAG: phosphonate ABC transporter, permease protein PhnE [Gemmatimonadales bacterium]